jgi:hypothetical protein
VRPSRACGDDARANAAIATCRRGHLASWAREQRFPKELTMSNTNAAGADGRARRKTLASQLDRLDGVIDDLSEGLNDGAS